MESENLIILWVEEYTGIYRLLEKREDIIVKDNAIWVHKNVLLGLLKKYAFATPVEKLQTWKRLKWIDTDREHLTSRISVNGKRLRLIKIPKAIPEELERLL